MKLFDLKNKETLKRHILGAVWGVASVIAGAVIVSGIEFLNKVTGYLWLGIEWLILYPSKLAAILGVSSFLLYVLAAAIGFVTGPVLFWALSWLWKLVKKLNV